MHHNAAFKHWNIHRISRTLLHVIIIFIRISTQVFQEQCCSKQVFIPIVFNSSAVLITVLLTVLIVLIFPKRWMLPTRVFPTTNTSSETTCRGSRTSGSNKETLLSIWFHFCHPTSEKLRPNARCFHQETFQQRLHHLKRHVQDPKLPSQTKKHFFWLGLNFFFTSPLKDYAQIVDVLIKRLFNNEYVIRNDMARIQSNDYDM